MAIIKIIFILLVLKYPTMCLGDQLVTMDDIARLSGLLEDLTSRQRDLQDQVTSSQVIIRSVEATVNHLMSENARLKASVNLLEDAVSQRARLEDMSKRIAALEATSSESSGPSAASKDIACSLPFTEVLGRCVFADPNESGTWEDMRQHCKTMNADLVAIDSADFLWQLIRHLQETGKDKSSYWVGGHRKSNTGTYHWVDGSLMKMGTPFWGYGNDFKNQQPYDGSELHICIYRPGLHFLHSCSFMQPPICQRK